MGKHLEQALPSVYTLQCLTDKVDNRRILRINSAVLVCFVYYTIDNIHYNCAGISHL